MANGSNENAANYNDEAGSVNDKTLQSILGDLLEMFEGTETIFSIKSRYVRSYVKISTSCIQKAIVTLRLQYLHLFVMHFPSESQYKSYRNLALYTEFSKGVTDLQNQVKMNATTEYFLNIKHLVHLTEIMASGLLEYQMLWYNCWRCGLSKGSNKSMDNPVIRCLAKWHQVPTVVLGKLVGFPTKCSCRSLVYHCVRGDINFTN